MVPNLRFAAPEISEKQQVSIHSDIFAVGTLLYYLVALNKNKAPNLLNQPDITDKSSHTHECSSLQRKLGQYMQGMDPEFDNMIRPMLNQNPQLRG
jgi:serine/threonine protein kinase